MVVNLKAVIYTHIKDSYHELFLWNFWPRVSATRPQWSLVNIGSDNGCVPSGNKAVPEPIYRQVSNISRTLLGNKIVYHSDVVGASPVGAAPTTSSFST